MTLMMNSVEKASHGSSLSAGYDYWMRTENLFSWPALVLLILGACNYLFSFIFALGFHRYHSA